MQLSRTRPFRLFPDAETFFDVFPRHPAQRFGLGEGRFGQSLLPRGDIIETNTTLTVRYELAGLELADIAVTLDDNVLTVRGARTKELPEGAVYRLRELPEGEFSRSIRLMDNLDTDQVEAKLTNGILKVVLQKRTDLLPRTIAIETG